MEKTHSIRLLMEAVKSVEIWLALWVALPFAFLFASLICALKYGLWYVWDIATFVLFIPSALIFLRFRWCRSVQIAITPFIVFMH